MTQKQPCDVSRAVSLLGSKWTLLIIYQLCSQERGFNELLRSVEGINPRALSLRLKTLVDDGLVRKTIQPTSPPQVHYALTTKGTSLKSIIEELGNWAGALPKS
jgi:DNA-binding HxlR family transcriptional regulator